LTTPLHAGELKSYVDTIGYQYISFEKMGRDFVFHGVIITVLIRAAIVRLRKVGTRPPGECVGEETALTLALSQRERGHVVFIEVFHSQSWHGVQVFLTLGGSV
jgi:hypothetical protein